MSDENDPRTGPRIRHGQANLILCVYLFASVHLHRQKQTQKHNVSYFTLHAFSIFIVTHHKNMFNNIKFNLQFILHMTAR